MQYFVFCLFIYILLWIISKWKGFEFTLVLFFSIFFLGLLVPVYGISILVIYFIIFFIAKIFELKKTKRNCEFSTYFGVPGSGKTTIASWLARNELKKKKSNRKVWSNVPIKGTYKLDKSDIGFYNISNGRLILDECGTEFDNRNFKKNFTDEQVKFFKLHRHYKVDINCFSQFWNDIDIKLRNLSTKLYLLKKSIIPFFIVRKEIGKKISINKETKEIIDEYYFKKLATKWYFAPKVWKMFVTDERPELPEKVWETW